MSFWYTSGITVSGVATKITSAAFTASAVSMTSKPSFLATSRDLDFL